MENPIRRESSSHTRSEWKRIVQAVESSVPLYESISEAISFWLAGPLRRRAIATLGRPQEGWTLDLGAGPGVSSRLLLSQAFEKVVGLDPSPKLMQFAKSSVGLAFHPVVGVAECLPFKEGVFKNILSCFALRDVENMSQSLREVSRVSEGGATVAIVDVGKPDQVFARSLVWLYVRFGMPLVARLLIRGRIRGNPFKMIIPTFQRLVTNDRLLALIEREVGSSALRESMLGALVVIRAEKPPGLVGAVKADSYKRAVK